MEKKQSEHALCACLYLILLKMKLTLSILFIAVIGTWAVESHAQSTRLTLKMENSSIEEVLKEIEDHSEFRFFYNGIINVDQLVSVNFKDMAVADALKDILEGTNIQYKVMGRQIMLSNMEGVSVLVTQQPRTVSGRVTDSSDAALPGVTIVIKGTTTGTITDSDGNYSFPNAPGDATLVFSFVGMKTQEITVEGRQIINIVMEEDKLSIDEIIVIGYGTAKRQDYTGSVSSIKMEGFPVSLLPNLNALESLKGNVSGLNIGATNTAGGQPSMLIRGQNSIRGNNDPLIVLDGVIWMGSLSDINPNDIASYDILKDAVSAAAYGSRSANGVIAITTKKGKLGKPLITANVSAAVQTWQNQPEMMKGEEWISSVNARNKYTPGTDSWAKSAGELANQQAGHETVWLDQVTRTGVIQNYQIAVSGATENLNYYVSTSYNDNTGIVKGDDFNRISMLGKINTTITSWLKVGVDASYSKRDYSGITANIGEAQKMSPYGVMFRDDQGNLEKYPYAESAINPLWGVDDGTRDNKDIRNNFRLNAYTVIDIPWIKGLNFKMNYLSYLDKNQTGNFYCETYYVKEGEGLTRYAPATVVGFLSQATGNINHNNLYNYVFDNILNYKNSFKKHSVEATLVATRDHSHYEEVNSTGSDFAANGNTALGMWGLHKATVQEVEMDGNERANIGYLGRLSYSYNDKYFFTTSYRRDGASVFGANRKWGNFAAFGTAWKISNEKFMNKFNSLNSLKIKLSWGQNGNQGVSPYATLSTVTNGVSAAFDYEFSDAEGKRNYGLFQNTLGNSDLGWEKTESWNTGFESTWLKNRLFVDLDVYFSKTTDQIFTREIPVMTGLTSIKTSMGQVNNWGVELTVKSVNIQTKDLHWTTAVTFWKNNNKLTKLYGQDADGDGKEDDDIANSLFIGKSLGAIYGYEQNGIVQEDDTEYMALTGAVSGDPKYNDLDGVKGITANDRKILGYSKVNFRLNMSNTASYKNFELYAMLVGAFGGNGYYLKSNQYAYMIAGTGRNHDNMTPKPSWTPENKSNVYPSVTFSGDSRFLGLQSRGFIRLQDVSLSYSFNQLWWIKKARISSLKLFLSAQNLVTITNWVGGDPEVGTAVLENTTPVPSTYSIGVNISL
jgi:TonB-linked SusC/RagA family outer membrane protein